MTSEVMGVVAQLFGKLLAVRTEVESKRYDFAMQAADEALSLCDRLPSDSEGVVCAAEGSIAANAFVAARLAGQLKRALGYAQREWKAAERNSTAAVRVRALNNRGLAHHELNNLVAAEADYRAALRVIDENPGEGLDSMKSLVLSHLGQLLTTQGQNDEAVETLSRSAAVRGFGLPFLGMTDLDVSRANDLATVVLNSGDYKRAEKLLREALTQLGSGDRQKKGILMCNLAETLHPAGENTEAVKVYRQAIELHAGDAGSSTELATDYLNLASVYMDLGQSDQLADCFKRAWDAVRATNPRSLVALRALWGLSMVRMTQKDYERARAAVERGLDLYEQMRPDVALTESGHQGFLQAYRSLLEMGMYLALEQSWPDELRSLIERGKARFTLERMARTSEKATFEHEVRDFDSVGGFNGLALDYFVGPNATFVAYEYNKNLGGARIDAGEKEVEAMVDEFREELLSSSRRAREGAAAARLSKMLFEKLRLDFTNLRHIYYLPDGPLWYAPFEALPVTAQAVLSERKPLGAMAPGSYAPSASVLAAVQRMGTESTERSHWQIVAFGEPENDAAFPVLRGTRNELDHLQQLANGRFHITVRRGADATRQNFLALAPSASHIHIAAHAVADFESEQPYIVFSGSGATQFLRSGELASLKLKAEVVFLSACSTSVGKRSTGEGVMSLARAFLWSGCRCVVASLWPMPDDAAPIIVNSFYSGLVAGLSAAQAAQLAREESRLGGGSASAWAGFQVLGDGDRWEDRYSLKSVQEDSR